MIAEIVEGCVYQETLSIYKKCFFGATFFLLLGLAIFEVSGKHLQYSKFWNSGSKNSKKSLISSKIGMLIFYTPALFACISSFWLFPDGGIRFLLLKSAITIHFLKRDLEVLFVHKFSAFTVLDSVIIISATYFTAAVCMVYFHHQTQGLPEPSIDLKYLGLVLFLVGISGNFYHHYLLSKLRQKNDKGYKLPQGGLFSRVVCPHYLFEITTFVGFSLISQTIYSYLCAVGVAFYLLGRSYTTRNWYLSKFENFPKSVKALIPFVF
ncbi:3-oxo-5-alpha-steroid 4-dehydrogenase family protein [Perilla frutescens var. hirtella]|uniref:3-oxo-5-alpha-steroid 4-dehydrogenase family protein n=1 Tax=Perilla frutescens var. hirtella TaxID=608512 RepID=A0AAD4J9Y2_PERFH|nr:3-oxo-5-alpha-steroid 4-dehydrogenase family protein [Perilla frutescens var. hirtella]